ncbi:LCP family protein [Staphylococcus agnetis]|uniref:LCP family protein n=1 Tax=Staphylococcus agnetis TaxID=985762 RepID=UPI0004E32FFD|nr:LCP family protein [Staphylococcus agnetis]KFE41821.1 LytR family transcriptional regulator [Staphylococcus agnetis]NJH65908.1 LytR family transcriptional regulator [Staphylococcus agnetis]PTH49115.1 LytR family transcriptional regulator [Staphylococcus agnetis]PTH73658.1 LytR family transcriptional regulator [Staphylococcus agnetis]PTH74852.1 LytR family transcriptional regulator [Staphylococcus agnetis]
MNKVFKYVLYLLVLILVIVPAIFAFILFNSSRDAFDDSFSQKDRRESVMRQHKVNPSKEPVSILFLGIDDSDARRENGQSVEQSRTDAMILSTLNPDKNQIRLLSIPRDTLSYIPKVGYYDKITHAHAYGGPESSMDTVEKALNIPVDYYVRINMDAFAETVDELGGIEYDVPYDLNEPNRTDQGRIKIKKGKQVLNGEEVLAVTRTRKQDSDLKRGQRQMEVLKILFRKAQETQSLHKLDDIIKIVGNNSQHNLSYDEIRALATNYLVSDTEIKTEQLKGENELLNGIYYINPDIDALIKTANRLRSDLGLEPIKDHQQFLIERVKRAFGEIPPLLNIDDHLLNPNTKKNPEESNSPQQSDVSQDPGSSETPPAQNQQDVQAPVQDQTYSQDNAHVQDPNTQSVY